MTAASLLSVAAGGKPDIQLTTRAWPEAESSFGGPQARGWRSLPAATHPEPADIRIGFLHQSTA